MTASNPAPTPKAYVQWYGKARHQDWTTPRWFFDHLDAIFRFDLDGAASDENCLCAEGSTLKRPVSWEGRRVFCNPPWSDIPPFIEYARYAEIAVLLVPARPNARWFHRALDVGAAPAFWIGRLRFGGNKSSGSGDSPVDCCLLIFGADAKAMVAEDLRILSITGRPEREAGLL